MMMQNLSVNYTTNFILNIQDGRWPMLDKLERHILHHCEILQLVDFQDGVIMLNSVNIGLTAAKISQFVTFSSEMYKFTR